MKPLLKPHLLEAVLGLLFVLMFGSEMVVAQPVDGTIERLQPIASFDEAVALDIDPTGVVYVVDAGAHALLRLEPDGTRIQQLGGPGEGEGQFDTPADIDVTNGLVLIVADAANGRVQRFSREFLFLESLTVDAGASEQQDVFGSEPAYRQQSRDLDEAGTGRPIGLVTADDNSMYILDEVENVVQLWDPQRNFVRSIGAYDQGDGSLVEPVALALSEAGSVFVADRGREAVVVYDAFGGFDRTMADGLAKDAQALFISDGLLLLVLPEKLLVYQARGLLEKTLKVNLGMEIKDVAIHNEDLYLLSEQGLYKTGWAEFAPQAGN